MKLDLLTALSKGKTAKSLVLYSEAYLGNQMQLVAKVEEIPVTYRMN